MMGLFDCVDDTVLVKKALLSVSYFWLAHFSHLPLTPLSYLLSPRRSVTLLRSCVTISMVVGCCCICLVLATGGTSVHSLSVFSLLVTTTSTGTDCVSWSALKRTLFAF